jgi:hypothetical protein
MFSYAPISEYAFCDIGTPAIPPIPPVIYDTHDGGESRHQKQLDDRHSAENRARELRRQEVIAVYEELVEGRPRVVAEIVAPFVDEDEYGREIVDFAALAKDIERVEALYRELREQDDEEVLLLI